MNDSMLKSLLAEAIEHDRLSAWYSSLSEASTRQYATLVCPFKEGDVLRHKDKKTSNYCQVKKVEGYLVLHPQPRIDWSIRALRCTKAGKTKVQFTFEINHSFIENYELVT